jgi:hypothetical protein
VTIYKRFRKRYCYLHVFTFFYQEDGSNLSQRKVVNFYTNYTSSLPSRNKLSSKTTRLKVCTHFRPVCAYKLTVAYLIWTRRLIKLPATVETLPFQQSLPPSASHSNRTFLSLSFFFNPTNYLSCVQFPETFIEFRAYFSIIICLAPPITSK